MPASASSAQVTFSIPAPSADYKVFINQTGGNGPAPNNSCRYWNATSRTTAGFTIERRSCNDGNLVIGDETASLDWLAIETR
jgi:hypothetical protein